MRHPSNAALRQQISDILATGRAVSTAELLTRLAPEAGRPITSETVYHQLTVLARRRLAVRVRRSGKCTYWAHPNSTTAAAGQSTAPQNLRRRPEPGCRDQRRAS